MLAQANDSKEVIDKNEVVKDLWQIRPCHMYKEEYADCTSIRARFHQYFIFGESIDCMQWKTDYQNCCRFEDKNDESAAQAIIVSETNRRAERLKPHFKNNVWERRKSPPDDWNKPLPDWMEKNFENSYLAVKAKELKGEPVVKLDENFGSFCTIM